MSAQPPSTRRLAIAIATAATSATIAIGVTAASLLGWFSPNPAVPPGPDPASETSPPTPTLSPVILVPVSPLPAPQQATDSIGDVQLAMDDHGRGRPHVHDADDDDRHDGREHDHEQHDEEDDDDD